jgi:hypothetical protein
MEGLLVKAEEEDHYHATAQIFDPRWSISSGQRLVSWTTTSVVLLRHGKQHEPEAFSSGVYH